MPVEKILMACMNDWLSWNQLGGHQLARSFASQGITTGYVAQPFSLLLSAPRLLWSSDARGRLATYRHGGRLESADASSTDAVQSPKVEAPNQQPPQSLWVYTPAAILTPQNRPLLRSEGLYRNWYRFSIPNVLRRVRKQGFGNVDVLYIDSVQHWCWARHIQARRRVFRIADYYPAAHSYNRAWQHLEREIAAAVDLVVYPTETLRPYVESLSPRRSMLLANGVNFRHFAESSCEPPREYASLNHPIAVYVGAIGPRFDVELIRKLADRLPELAIVIVGPDESIRSMLADRPNVHLFGRRPFAEIPRYLKHADVGLIPFDTRAHSDYVNAIHPLKLYEYMASGLPVVATRWQTLEAIGSPATLVDSHDAFIAAVEQIVARPPVREPFTEFARGHDWSRRAEQLLAALE